MEAMFYGCASLKNLNGLSKWNVGNVKRMSYTFGYCGSVTDISALSEWDTGSVIHMNSTFCGCRMLSNISPLAKWNVKNTTTISRMFKNCASLEDISPLAKWDTGNITEMQDLFNSTGIKETDAVMDWDVKSLQDVHGVFTGTGVRKNLFAEKIPMACPKTGSFTAWKKCCDEKMVKLLIPEDARRSSSLGEKCRCNKALVLQIFNRDGTPGEIAVSSYDHSFMYRIGSTVSVPNFDTDRFNECAPGIHFFMDRDAAEKYR